MFIGVFLYFVSKDMISIYRILRLMSGTNLKDASQFRQLTNLEEW